MNPHPSPIAAAELMESEELDTLAAVEALGGETDCPEGCTVEADGICPHGYESALRTLGAI